MTGASGFLGSHTAELLHDKGHEIQALVRATSQTEHLKKRKIPLVLGALPHCENFAKSLEGQDVIIHIAAVVKALSQKDFLYHNHLSTQNLVKTILSLKKKPQKFIHISTIAVHDPSQSKDFCQPPEQCQPLSHYGESKMQAERSLEPLKDEMTVTILRPPVLYGERDWELFPLIQSVQKGLTPIWGKGDKQFSMCYVKDVAEAIATLVESPSCDSEIFCLDDGAEHSWRSVALEIGKVIGKEPRLIALPSFAFTLAAGLNQTWAQLRRRPHVFTLNKLKEMKQARWICGHQKLANHFKWEPSTSLKEGLQNTLEYYRAIGKLSA